MCALPCDTHGLVMPLLYIVLSEFLMLLCFCVFWQVDEVKNIMSENIEKVLSRGEKLDLLVDKTDNLMFEVSVLTNDCMHVPQL